MSASNTTKSFTGRCPCGLVQVEFAPGGQEAKSAYCHCYACQRWYMSPVSVDVMLHDAAPGRGFTLTGEVTEDARTLPTHKTVRMRCTGCKSPVACKWQINGNSDKTGWSFPVALFILEEGQGLPQGLPKPTHHVWYKNKTVDVKDGLPKWASWPDWSEQIPE